MIARALPRPDFLRPTRRAGLLAWVWCLTGLLVLAASTLEAAEAWQSREQTLQRLARAGATAATAATGTTAPAADAATRAADVQAARWLQRLALPWPTVFGAAEAAAVEGAQFTGLGFDAQGQLRLEGQSATSDAALAAADALRAASGGDGAAAPAWQGVTLARLDSAADGQRFEIVARRAAPAPR